MNKMVSLEIFNQDQAIKLGLNLEDLVIIKYIIDKSDTVKRIYIKENNEIIYYFEYRDIISYLPIIFNKQSINLNIDYVNNPHLISLRGFEEGACRKSAGNFLLW